MRKRGRRNSSSDEGEDVTFSGRIELKRSMDSGLVQVYDKKNKKSRSLEELCLDTHMLIHDAPFLSKGTYGDVKRLDDENGKAMAVAKITGCIEHLLGDFTNSPFRSEHLEPRILNFLWKKLVEEERITPHMVAPIGSHAIVPVITNQRKYSTDSTEMNNSLVYFMEMAAKQDMHTHLKSIIYDREKFELHFRVLLFQVCYTLECIYQRFPDFRHNDLRDANVYMHSGPTEGYDEYVINGKTFYLPRIGAIALIGDFDFATIPGYMFDNYKTLEQEWHTPSYCINTRRDQGSDMHVLITYLRQTFQDNFRLKLRRTIQRLYGKKYARNYNNLHPMPGTSHRPSPKQLLNDEELFAQFLEKPLYSPPPAAGEETILPPQVFRGNVNGPVVFPTTWDSAPHDLVNENGDRGRVYERHCPLIVPRRVFNSPEDLQSVYNSLPSVIYYREHCVPADKAIEQEDSMVYDAVHGKDILAKMEEVYDIQPDAENDFIGYGLDPDFKEEFLETVLEVASDFIRANHVPGRWWFAAFSCAWNDTIYDMNLVPACQKCWDMTTWVDLWDRYGDVSYTNLQMLHFCMQWTWHRNLD